jgi:gluconokinase
VVANAVSGNEDNGWWPRHFFSFTGQRYPMSLHPQPSAAPTSLVVMGVAGCGKSSVATAFAAAQNLAMVEGDSLHSAANVAKMSQGVPLTDADRDGWLTLLGSALRSHPHGVVMTCSALKLAYRQRLRTASPGLRFAFLDIDRAIAMQRVQARAGAHFFSSSLVDNQFATLQSPVGEPGVLQLDAALPLPALLQQLGAWWHQGAPLKAQR